MVSFDKPTLKLRIIPFEIRSGSDNMALDHYLAKSCEDDTLPLIRFYGWSPFCLSIGYHQNKNLIDYIALRSAGYDCVRRPTGGRAIFHSDELTYSVIFPKTLFQPQPLYQFIHVILGKALNALGFPVELKSVDAKIPKLINETKDFACFTRSAYSEIQYKNKKVVGSAQRIYQGSILQHGSILIGHTHKRIIDFLKAGNEDRIKIEKELKNKTICLTDIKEISVTPDTIVRCVIKELTSFKNIQVYCKPINQSELNQARIFSHRKMELNSAFQKEEIGLY